MKNIINSVKALLNSNTATQKSLNCNYANNYYGDQICQMTGKK